MKLFRFFSCLASIALLGMGASAHASTITDVENTITGGTFLEFNLSSNSDTNGSVSASYTPGAGVWGYPDSSNGSILVNGSGLDDKGNSSDEFQADYSGLSANTDYFLWVIAVQNVGSTAESHDFEWGLSSGSLTTVAGGIDGTVTTTDAGYDGAYAVNVLNTLQIDEGGSGNNDKLIGVLVGKVSTNGSGDLTLYFDNGTNASTSGGNEARSQLDGVVFTTTVIPVPEPTSLALMGLGSLAMLVRRR